MSRANLHDMIFRLAEDERDVAALVAMRDTAARWQLARGIEQWRPGELTEDYFLERIRCGEVWLACGSPRGRPLGACEIWWEDPFNWGWQPPSAGYLHRLMIDRSVVPPGTGRQILAVVEHRVSVAGRQLVRFGCAASNNRLRKYYVDAGYREVGQCPHSRPSNYPVVLFEKPTDQAALHIPHAAAHAVSGGP